jgi:hypothetical protein
VGRLAGGFLGGLGGGIATALFAGAGSGLVAGVVDGLAVAVVVAGTVHLAGRRTPSRGLRGLRWSPTGLLAGACVGLAVGRTIGSTADLGLTAGMVSGTIAGLATGMVAGLERAPDALTEQTSPALILGRDRGTFWMTGSATALALGLTAGLGIEPAVGVAAGFGYGLTVAYLQAATGSLATTRLWLAMTGRMPLRLMTFLDDAHRIHGVLRQVGAVYEFRHLELQRHLATPPAHGTAGQEPTPAAHRANAPRRRIQAPRHDPTVVPLRRRPRTRAPQGAHIPIQIPHHRRSPPP